MNRKTPKQIIKEVSEKYGISEQKATTLLAFVGRQENISKMSKHQLKVIPFIGEQTAKRIKDAEQ